MYLLGSVGGINTGEMIFQLLLFALIPIILLAGAIALFIAYQKKSNQSKGLKEKLEKTLFDKEK